MSERRESDTESPSGGESDTGPVRAADDPLPPIEGPWEHHETVVHDPDAPDRDGLRLHYVAAGPEDGEPVVLLHGFPQFWYTWHRQLPALADAGYRAVAPDLRGYNRSERPSGVAAYRLDRLLGDVRGLLDALGHESAHLVGHDWGGVLGWELAGRSPEAIDRLAILNAPHPAAYHRALRTLDQLRRSWYVGWFQLPRLPEWSLGAQDARAIAEMHHDPWFDDVDRERYRAAASRPGALAAAVNYYRAVGRATVRDRIARAVPGRERPPDALRAREIDVPTLVLWGLGDPALSPRLVDGLDRWVSDLQVQVFREVDHWLPAARPDAVATALLAFFGDAADVHWGEGGVSGGTPPE